MVKQVISLMTWIQIFLLGYVVIEDAGINNDGNIQHDNSEDSYAGAYAEKPLADEVWLENYN